MGRGDRCSPQARPQRDQFYRPLLMSVEMSRPKQRSCCSHAAGAMTMPRIPCPPCDGNPPPTMAYAMGLACSGNRACGSCGISAGNGNGGGGGKGSSRGSSCCTSCNENCVRLPGQGPCDPPCFSTMVFPRYAPFVPEPKCGPTSLEGSGCMDACAMAPVGGTNQIGSQFQSCFSCNTCGGNGGRMNVCNQAYPGANNQPCFASRKSSSCNGNGSTW